MNSILTSLLKSCKIILRVPFRSVRNEYEARNILRGLDYIKDSRLNKGLAFTMLERHALGLHGLLAPKFITAADQLEIVKISISRYKSNLNKYLFLAELQGLAFTMLERHALGLHGLLAPKFITAADQLEIAKISISRYKSNLNKYLFLAELQETNEKLFYNLLMSDIEKYMPIIYTPTVGLACQKFGVVYSRPRGLYVTIHDRGHVSEIISNWPEHRVKAICFTDGERILGLGDLGAYGMGIPVGKLALYTALAGIRPYKCLPIVLDTGTDNARLIKDPLYIGLRRTRVRGPEYDDFIDEFLKACVDRYGYSTLLQFEDFALRNSHRLLKKYRNKYCTFNDDIQGTAAVSVAGIIASSKVTKMMMSDHTFMFLGAGSAALGIASLLVDAIIEEGKSKESATKKIFFFDLDGLLTNKRPGGVPEHASVFARDLEQEHNFEQAVIKYKPSCLIGCSTSAGAFTPKILGIMAKNNKNPLIFALSNPTANAECSAQEAYDHTEGRCIFASGSPFPPVTYKGKVFKTGQGNNAFIFPGLALGVLAVGCYHIPDYMFLVAARALANIVTAKDLEEGNLYPPLSSIRSVSLNIAVEIGKTAFIKNLASAYPKPTDMKAHIEGTMYNSEYTSAVPPFYYYPEYKIKLDSFEDANKEYVPKWAKSSKT